MVGWLGASHLRKGLEKGVALPCRSAWLVGEKMGGGRIFWMIFLGFWEVLVCGEKNVNFG